MDILIKNGLLYDGSGKSPYYGDLLISGKTIAAIGTDLSAEGVEIIDAAGRMVTPGFIDIHRHCDIQPWADGDFGELELAQGITTTMVGNCGLAPVPAAAKWQKELNDYLEPVIGAMPKELVLTDYQNYIEALERADLPINMGFFAASDSIRIAVKGFGSAPYTADELLRAQAYVRQAMNLGAFGVTLGIMYQPECYSTKDELTAIVSAAAGVDAVLCTHIRGEGDSLTESVAEVIEIARRAGVALNISHFKATGIRNWGSKLYEAIGLIEAARAAGQDVTVDFYPYDGGSTTLQSLLPPTMMRASMAELISELAAPSGRLALREELNKVHEGWDNMSESIGWERILISSVNLAQNRNLLGKTIAAAAAERGYQEPSDLVAELLVAEQGKVGIIVLSMSPDDVDEVARLPYSMLISDALYGGDSASAHPRLLGSTGRFLHDFVHRRRVIPMEQAIQKMTSMPAERIGLADRGWLRKGYQADILIFDPEHFTDHADYTGNHEMCSGIDLVLLAGQKVYENGVLRIRNGGTLLKKKEGIL